MKPAREAGQGERRAAGWLAWLGTIALGTGALIGAVAWWAHVDVSAPAVAPARSAVASLPASPAMPLRHSDHQAEGEALVRLDASRLFELGYGGGLIVDRDTRAALELALAVHGDEAGMQRLETALRGNMPKEEAERVLRLVGSYRAYRADLRRELQDTPAPRNLEQMNALIEQAATLRARHFDAATGAALFGAQEAHARHAMARAAIENDPALDAETRARRLHEVDAALAPDLRQELGLQETAAARVAETAAAMRRRGADEAQVQAYRVGELGSQQAAALAEMEAQQAHWQRRYETYAVQRAEIEAAVSDPVQRDARLEALRRQHYAEEELDAARAYELAQRR